MNGERFLVFKIVKNDEEVFFSMKITTQGDRKGIKRKMKKKKKKKQKKDSYLLVKSRLFLFVCIHIIGEYKDFSYIIFLSS